MNRNNYGFTLIELIVTLAVASILFAVAAPNLSTTGSNNKLSTQYNKMRGDFAFARNLAITRNVAVTISSNNGTDWSNGWTIVTPTKTVRVSDVENNLIISSALNTLTYNFDGTANITATQTIKICDNRTDNVGKQLNINLAGRVRLTNNVSCP